MAGLPERSLWADATSSSRREVSDGVEHASNATQPPRGVLQVGRISVALLLFAVVVLGAAVLRGWLAVQRV